MYKNINSIVVRYKMHYIDFFAHHAQSEMISWTPTNNIDRFGVVCLNPECTNGYISLNSEINKAISEHISEYQGYKRCDGSESTKI